MKQLNLFLAGRRTKFLALLTLLTMFASILRAADPVASKTMSEIVAANEYTVSYTSGGVTYATMYKSFALDANITVSTSGEDNCGSFWGTSPNHEWRLYTNKNGDVTITAASGYTLKSVTYTFTVSNSGTLNTSGNGSNISSTYQKSSGSAISISGTSYTLYVGNTNNRTNGQVRITAISVTYASTGPSCSAPTSPENSSFSQTIKFCMTKLTK